MCRIVHNETTVSDIQTLLTNGYLDIIIIIIIIILILLFLLCLFKNISCMIKKHCMQKPIKISCVSKLTQNHPAKSSIVHMPVY